MFNSNLNKALKAHFCAFFIVKTLIDTLINTFEEGLV